MRTVTLLVSMGAVMGCAERAPEPLMASNDDVATMDASPGAPATSTSDDLSARIAADLKRLTALGVVEVHELSEPSYDRAAVARLDRFTAIAEQAAAIEGDDADADRAVAENLLALRSLQIVDVATLIYDEPSRAGSCYGPCPPSTKAEHRRAVQLDRIVAATKGL